ncbi:MAG: FkbM family methyltransferase [Gemmataceae bacterium]
MPGLAWAQRIFLRLVAPNEAFPHKIDHGPAKGLKFLIRLPEDKAMWKGTYEAGFCLRLKDAVRAGDICYDIGAYRGYTAGVMALAGAGRVIAFEPMPENQKRIRLVFEMNPDLPLSMIPKAVADLEGEKVLEIHRDQSMNRLKSVPGSSDGERIVVETTTVDATAKARGMWPNLLKIDVEGAEEAVLKGAKEVLKKSVRGVFMEIHHPQAEAACRALLEQAGYECVWKEYEWGNYANHVMFQIK